VPGRPWIALFVPVFSIAVALIIKVVRALVRQVRRSLVAAVPLVPEQRVVLEAAGALVLAGEGRRLSTDFARLRFALTGEANGAPVPLRPVLVRTVVSGVSRVRVSLQHLALPAPGAYRLRVDGIPPRPDPASRLVFARPFGAALPLRIVALVLLGQAAIGSVVLTVLALLGP